MTQIFSDGFESGDFSAWTGTSGSPTVQPSVVHHGSYAVLINANSEDFYKTVTGQTTFFARAYCQIAGMPASNGQDAVFILLYGASGNFLARVGLHYNVDHLNWRIYYRNNGGLTSSYSTSYLPSVDTWFCLEIKLVVGSGTGEIRVYCNGNEAATLTGLDNDDQETLVAQARFGNVLEYATSVYYDCVVFADAYIGPEASVTVQTVADTLTVNEGVLRNKLLSIADLVGLQDSEAGNKNLMLLENVEISDLVQALKTLAVTETLSLADAVFTPSSIVRITEEISLAEVASVGEVGAKKTKLFLILGEVALQLTGD